MKPREKHRNDVTNFVPSGGSRNNREDSENIQNGLTTVEFPNPSNCQLEETGHAISDDSIPYCDADPTFAEKVSFAE